MKTDWLPASKPEAISAVSIAAQARAPLVRFVVDLPRVLCGKRLIVRPVNPAAWASCVDLVEPRVALQDAGPRDAVDDRRQLGVSAARLDEPGHSARPQHALHFAKNPAGLGT